MCECRSVKRSTCKPPFKARSLSSCGRAYITCNSRRRLTGAIGALSSDTQHACLDFCFIVIALFMYVRTVWTNTHLFFLKQARYRMKLKQHREAALKNTTIVRGKKNLVIVSWCMRAEKNTSLSCILIYNQFYVCKEEGNKRSPGWIQLKREKDATGYIQKERSYVIIFFNANDYLCGRTGLQSTLPQR